MNADTALKALAAIGVAAVALTGCTTQAEPTPVQTTAAPVETEAPEPETEAPTETVTYEVGDVIEGDVPALPEGQSVYTLSDGTGVVVQADQPLPEAVRADIIARSAVFGIVPAKESDVDREASMASQDALNSTAATTGKTIVTIAGNKYYGLNGELEKVAYMPVSTDYGTDRDVFNVFVEFPTPGEAYAHALERVAEQPDAHRFEVLNHFG